MGNIKLTISMSITFNVKGSNGHITSWKEHTYSEVSIILPFQQLFNNAQLLIE